MAPFPAAKTPRVLVLAKSVGDDEAYGTFQGRPRSQDTSTPSSRVSSSNSKFGALLRAVSVVGLVLLAVGYVTKASSSSSSIVAVSNVQGASETVKSDEVAEELSTTDMHQQFVDNINAGNMREYLHAYSSVPHSCGTEQDYRTALFTTKMFESFGIKAEIKEYYTLLSTLIRRHLAIVEPAESVRELT